MMPDSLRTNVTTAFPLALLRRNPSGLHSIRVAEQWWLISQWDGSRV